MDIGTGVGGFIEGVELQARRRGGRRGGSRWLLRRDARLREIEDRRERQRDEHDSREQTSCHDSLLRNAPCQARLLLPIPGNRPIPPVLITTRGRRSYAASARSPCRRTLSETPACSTSVR